MTRDSAPQPLPGARAATATICTGRGNLPAVAVESPLASALIYLHGAHVAQWRPRGHEEVLWLSSRSQYQPGQPIRGGVPICWPWFGPHPQRERTDVAPHGFARLRAWTFASTTVLPDGGVRLTFTLGDDAESRKLWPHAFALTYAVTVAETLTLELTVENPGPVPFRYEEALHSYFAVGDVRRAEVHGLAQTPYVDKVRALGRFTEGEAPITFQGETDRVYLGTTAPCRLVDAVGGRSITIAKEGSSTTVVWNPWIAKAASMKDFDPDGWPSMACVESANALEGAITLAPGEKHLLRVRISVGAQA